MPFSLGSLIPADEPHGIISTKGEGTLPPCDSCCSYCLWKTSLFLLDFPCSLMGDSSGGSRNARECGNGFILALLHNFVLRSSQSIVRCLWNLIDQMVSCKSFKYCTLDKLTDTFKSDFCGLIMLGYFPIGSYCWSWSASMGTGQCWYTDPHKKNKPCKET